MNFNAALQKTNDTFAEINLNTLRKNFLTIKKFASVSSGTNMKVCSIVKANAYGHGMNETGMALSEYGTDYLGTADYSESVILSDHLKKFSKRNTPVLCLGNITDEKYFEDILKRNIEVTINELSIASKLNDYASGRNKILNVQLQVDSGINRIGFKIKDTYSAVAKMKKFKSLNIKGIYSHFATSEIHNNSFASEQLREFKSLVKEIEQNIMKFELRHICNTGGILNFNDPYFNMVRPGISLYGYYPDRKKLVKDIGIKPVMTLKSRVSFIKTLDKNTSISYGRKYFTRSKTKIASIPAGYGDGYSRLLTNKSSVLIRGKKYRTVGAVCMDWIMADLGAGSRVKVNDEVIIFGKENPADILSEMIGTIPYEIISNVSSRVQRVYVEK